MPRNFPTVWKNLGFFKNQPKMASRSSMGWSSGASFESSFPSSNLSIRPLWSRSASCYQTLSAFCVHLHACWKSRQKFHEISTSKASWILARTHFSSALANTDGREYDCVCMNFRPFATCSASWLRPLPRISAGLLAGSRILSSGKNIGDDVGVDFILGLAWASERRYLMPISSLPAKKKKWLWHNRAKKSRKQIGCYWPRVARWCWKYVLRLCDRRRLFTACHRRKPIGGDHVCANAGIQRRIRHWMAPERESRRRVFVSRRPRGLTLVKGSYCGFFVPVRMDDFARFA